MQLTPKAANKGVHNLRALTAIALLPVRPSSGQVSARPQYNLRVAFFVHVDVGLAKQGRRQCFLRGHNIWEVIED